MKAINILQNTGKYLAIISHKRYILVNTAVGPMHFSLPDSYAGNNVVEY